MRGIHAIEPVVRVELTRNRCRQLLLEPDELVFVTLHNRRIFAHQPN